jgi:hypothetical protein
VKIPDFEYQGNEDWEEQLATLTDGQRRRVLTTALCSGGHWSGDLAATIRWVVRNYGSTGNEG